MNESEQYIANSIRTWVWSGFYSLTDIDAMMADILEPDADEPTLREFAKSELRAKLQAQAAWPPITDCDRLDAAFNALNSRGVIALQNAGYTMSEGYEDVGEALAALDRSKIRGYCFYHGQDLARAVGGDGLMLAFGDLADTAEETIRVGALVKAELEHQDLKVEWDGNPEKRINLPQIQWQRRAPLD